MCQGLRHRHHPAGEGAPVAEQRAAHTVDRRVVLKAAAVLAAMTAAPRLADRQSALAQEVETLAGTWSPDDAAFAAASAPGEPVVFETDFPITAAGASWDASVEFPVVIEVSFSNDGATFTEPVLTSAAAEDAGRPDRDGRWYADLAFADGHTYVRYRTLDADLAPAAVTGLTFHYVDASGGPYSDAVGANALGADAVGADVARPRVISRAGWGANEAYRYDREGEIWPQEFVPVQHVIIHHTDTPNFQDPFVAMRSIYYYHAVTRGWGDIGYNYLVDFRGNIFEGRVGGENVVGGHAYQYAYGSCGIGTIGDFDFQDVTPAAQAAIIAITAYVGRNLDPFGAQNFQQVPGLPRICAHRDVNQSACPGNYLYDDLPTIRRAVADALAVAGPGFTVGQSVRTSVADGNLRARPTTDGTVRAVLPLGTTLTITSGPTQANGYTWYGVSGAYGDGYCATVILAASGSQPAPGAIAVGDTVEVATDLLNLRRSASTSAAIDAQLPQGTQGTVLAGPTTGSGYTWFQLRTSRGTGWCVVDFLREVGGSTTPPEGGLDVGDFATVSTDALSLRESPGNDERVLAVMPYRTPLQIINEPRIISGYTWIGVVSAQYGAGWVAAEFLVPAPAPSVPGQFAVGESVFVNTDALNMRSGPGTDRSITATLPTRLQLQVTDGPVSYDGDIWYGVYARGYGGGWVLGQYLTRSGAAPTPTPTTPPPSGGIAVGTTVQVVDGSLNFRTGPSTSAAIANVVPEGTRFSVVGGPTQANGYTWWQVRNSGYGTGWCVGQYLRRV